VVKYYDNFLACQDTLDGMEKQTVNITVTANLDYSGLVRHIANEVFESAKFSKAWCGRLKLVVDELFMNAVRYGSTKDKSLVCLSFEYDDKGIRFTIEDDGTGPQAKSAEELKAVIHRNETNNDLTRTSGRGLALIAKMWTDGMQVAKSTYGGIGIGFVKKLENATGAPPSPPMELIVPPVEPLRVTQAPKPMVTNSATQLTKAPVAQGPTYEVRLSGEIDQSNIMEKIAPVTEQIGAMPDGSVLVLDFSGLTYINSTFIGQLAGWYRTMKEKGGALRLSHINDSVREILTLVGLINVLEVQNS
jgi:anti-anti-sigma factor